MKNKSFTLIELLVVIVIIGILAGVIIVSVSSSINKANFAKAQSFSNTVQNELLGDLVSEWTLNSPAVSGKTEDSWGNNDGTLYGANGLPQLQTKENCVYGSCYLFDGVDDYIDCGNDNSLTLDHITISMWINPLILGAQSGIIEKHTSPTYGWWIRKESNDKLNFLVVTASGNRMAGSTINLVKGWFNIVGTYNGTDVKIFINGEDKTVSQEYLDKEDIINDEQTLCIGRIRWSNRTFNGKIDDVRIYNSALSSSQIKQNYIAGLNSLLANNSLSKEEYLNRIKNLSLND